MKTCETNYVNPLYPDKITEFESLKTILYKKKFILILNISTHCVFIKTRARDLK